MKVISKLMMVVLLATVAGFAAVPLDKPACSKATGDEPFTGPVIPYLGGRQSPGDSIGTTTYDYQANGSSGQRILVDDLFQAHIDWMKRVAMSGAGDRRIEWQFRYPDGNYYGEVDASPMTAGYCQLDVTQDANPDSQRTVIAYHYNPGTYWSWIDVDQGNGWGILPGNPAAWQLAGNTWPYIGVTANNNVVMITGDQAADVFHAGLTTDMGTSWTLIDDPGAPDSALALSHFARSSRNSAKVVLAWTQSIGVEYSGLLISQMANNVFYMLSTDNGVTWGTPVNVTNYLPPGQMVNGDTTPWAYCDVNAVFDNSDNLHLAWGTNMAWVYSDTLYFDDRSKIFHWDQVSNTITTVNTPSWFYTEPNGWWLEGTAGLTGAWKMACDDPQLVVGTGNELYCVWTGNDDPTDVSAAGYFNGELYGSTSANNGATWTGYRNLTNTRSPGAAAGACMDEDYCCVSPKTVNDSLYITFVEDKDAGGCIQTPAEGVPTVSPVRCLVVHKSALDPGVEETKTGQPKMLSLSIAPNPMTNRSVISYTLPAATDVSLKLYTIDGRTVKTYVSGSKPAGIHTVNIDTRMLANGIYVALLKASGKTISSSFVVVR